MEIFSLITLSAVGLLIVLVNVILWLKIRRLEKIADDSGNSSGNGIALHKTKEDLQKLDKDIQELYEISSRISKISKKGVCKVGITRFNAFSEKSGNQSFAVALLNFRDNGIVLSNLQTAQGARLFIRPIQQGEISNGGELLLEEKKALERAKQVIF